MAIQSSEATRDRKPNDIAEEIWNTKVLPKFFLDGLRPKSISDYFYTYHRWFNYGQAVSSAISSQTSHHRIPSTGTSPSIIAFVEDIRAGASTATALIEARRLRRLLPIIDQTFDISLLNQLIRKMQLEVKAHHAKDDFPNINTPLLVNLGYDLIRAADEQMQNENSYSLVNTWRDGFIIALLALRPLRISNFVNLRLQDNLFIFHDIAWFRFQAHETKNHQCLQFPYPGELFSQLRRYIGEIRPKFIRRTASPYLWLSRRGEPMHEAMLRRTIKTRTSAAFGFALSPHRFRHAAVTYLAMTHPEWIIFGSDILGHSDPAVAESHYNHASPEGAATNIQDHLITEAKSTHGRSARARQTRSPERESLTASEFSVR